jgi:periplasmic mercuric ion binding protein
MKTLTTIFLSILFLAATAQEKKNREEIKIKTSAVCDMCKNTLEKAMAYESGVKKSSLDVDSKILTVVFDPRKTNPEKIRKAINKVGYDADDSPADAKAYEKLHECCKKDAKH